MSRTLSTNSGSLDSLNVWLRCGCKPNAAHIRRIVVWEKPVSAAIERIDQCVASAGVVRNVRDHRGNLIVVDGSRAARACLVKQAITAVLQKSATPLANGVFIDAKFGSHRLAWQTICTPQDRAAPLR
jgi:hypothetical protein